MFKDPPYPQTMKVTTVTIFYKKSTHLITPFYSICLWFWAYIKGKNKQSFHQMPATSLGSISTETASLLQINAMPSESYLCPFPATVSFDRSSNENTTMPVSTWFIVRYAQKPSHHVNERCISKFN